MGVIEAGAKPVKLAEGFAFTEGCTSDASGNVFFVDQPQSQILKWTFDGEEVRGKFSGGKLSTFLEPSGHSNGMSFDGAGNLIACADLHNEVWSIAPDKRVKVLVRGYEGKLLNGPNDVWVRPDGGLYLSDPLYPRDWWKGLREPTVQVGGEFVFYVDARTGEVRPVVTDLVKPNGIIGTPDGKTLYVSDIRGKRTWRYRMEADGSLSDKRLFCEEESDGMTMDEAGNVYVTNKGVSIYSPQGQRLERVDMPAWVGNTCFGGADMRTLFMAASKEIYALRMTLRGVGPA